MRNHVPQHNDSWLGSSYCYMYVLRRVPLHVETPVNNVNQHPVIRHKKILIGGY